MTTWVLEPSAALVATAGLMVECAALAAPATSVNVPKLVVPLVTPTIVDVPVPPLLVMLPDANGVPAVGRTCIPDHVIRERVVLPPPVASLAVTVIVIVLLVTVTVGDN